MRHHCESATYDLTLLQSCSHQDVVSMIVSVAQLYEQGRDVHGNMYELDKVADETHDAETDGDCLAQLDVFCG